MASSSLKEKRILRDIKTFINSKLDNVGIYCDIDDSNLDVLKAMIIGPKNTPYENGFYFFEINFPCDYPYNPPKVTFMTSSKNVRFNPNLYTNGKVCLSILGTWNGPGWSAALSLNTVLLSIQSLLNENPIQNEPGYENEIGNKCKKYNKLIEYYNINIATLNMLEKPPYGYDIFLDIMKKHFVKNIDYYNNYIKINLKDDMTTTISTTYGMSSILRIKDLENRIKSKYSLLLNDPNINANNANNTINTNVDNSDISLNNIKDKKTKKCPSDPAKLYDIGYVKLSDNDNKNYVVIEAKGPKRTFKKWVLNKV